MKTKSILIYAGVLLSGLFLGYFFFGGSSSPQSINEHIAESHTDVDGNVIYTCSMHPSVRQNEPGNCPICGMELIKADDSGNADLDPNTLVMSKAAMQLADIQTTRVIKKAPVSTIYLPGKVKPNLNQVSGVSAHVSGRITALFVDFEGAFVRKGDKMASLYSPELVAAQQELLETVKYKTQNPVLYQAARKKLMHWELPTSTIESIEQSGKVMQSVDIVSPVTGYVSAINVNRQQHVVEGTLMYTVADLSSVWVIFDAYESQAGLIREDQTMEFTTASIPGKTFTGTVDFIDPLLKDNSRSLGVRVKVENPNNLLKPNMLTEGILEGNARNEEAIMIPRSAVMWTGKRSIVYVKDPESTEPAFKAREVLLGNRVGNNYIIIDGLEVGEEVVTNGTFKLDSAAQLADKLSMMNRSPGTGANKTGHEGHTATGNTPSETAKPANEDNTHENHSEKQTTAVPMVFKSQLQDVVSKYLELKNALVETDQKTASASASTMLEELSAVDMTLVKGDDHIEWMRFLKDLQTHTNIIANTSDIVVQRAAFSTLSPKLIETIKHFELSGVFYQQFCPMSNNGDGAYWLSTDEEIANPYYGDAMHNCGETITKIEF